MDKLLRFKKRKASNLEKNMIKQYIQKPISFIFFVAALLILGVSSLFDLPVKMYPQIKRPSFRVSFQHKAISRPKDLYQHMGKKIEESLSRLKGLEDIKSTYYQGRGNYRLFFEWNIDPLEMKGQLETLLAGFKSADPENISFNTHFASSKSSGNMLVAIGHGSFSSSQLKETLDSSLLPTLKSLEDVSQVNFWGWKSESMVLRVDRKKLLSFRLTINDIILGIQKSLKSHLAGHINHGQENGKGSSITIPAKIQNLEELENLVIKQDLSQNLTLRIKDLGHIETISKESPSIYRLNGLPAKYMMVEFKEDGDLKRTSDHIEELLEDLKIKDPRFITNIIVNPSFFISNSIRNLFFNACFGGLMAILIVFFFLRAWGNTVIIGLSIPFCLISSFILMKIFGLSINIISLGGLAIGIGLILDGAIVTLDNIHRLLLEKYPDGDISKNEKVELIIEGTKEVALPIIVSLLTSIVTFIPLIFSTSYTQAILGNLAKTIVFTLSMSLVSSLIIVPVISYFFMGTKIKNQKIPFSLFKNKLRKGLNVFLITKKRAAITLGIALLTFLSSLALIPNIKKEIMALPSTTLMDIRLHFEGNRDILVCKKVIDKIEAFAKTRKEILNVASYQWGPTYGIVTFELRDRNQFKELKDLVEEKFPSSPEVRITPAKWNPGKLPLPRKQHLVLNLSGAGEAEMTAFSNSVRDLRHKFNAGVWRRPWINSGEELSLNFFSWVSPQTRSSVMELLRASTDQGAFVTTLFFEGLEKNLNLLFLPHQINSFLEDIEYFPFSLGDKFIPLKALADIKFQERSYTPLSIIEGKSSQQIHAWFRGKDKEPRIRDFKKEISKLKIPEGLTLHYPELNKEITKSFQSFKTSLLVSIALIFLLILFFFNSLKYPLIILSTVFFGITGVLVGLFITGSTLSLNSMLGTILLSGLVVNNAILLIDFYKREKEKKTSTLEAIYKAVELRIRPILLTTLTTLLGVLPIALALGEAGEILQPLGIAVFFGLLVSTLLTMIVVPSFIRLID